ncbi:uncharacterized protein LOC132273877 isoform X3 [Cornus florida]|uniref:uncharacterized protein LOC132273877 isoform X3 n=1 Tax=Cornus florida TaxID=4283 RepID=UPI0028A18B05|nr:uncharacterized protein LOC132273877 isoform X3 [Cornus florida]
MELKEALYSLNSLEIKLKAPKEVLLQTQIADALMWAKKDPSLDCDVFFIPILCRACMLCSTPTCFRINSIRIAHVVKREVKSNGCQKHVRTARYFDIICKEEYFHGCSQARYSIVRDTMSSEILKPAFWCRKP